MKKTEKIKYEIDPHNRLIFTKTGRKSKLPKYREVIDGRIKIDKNNSFIYHVKQPQDSKLPQQVKFSGKWYLNKNHDLVLTLDKKHKMYAGDKLTIKGEIKDAKANKLVFSVAAKDILNQPREYILNLSGSWQADKYNRLTFNVKRNKGITDILTFKGGWSINKQNQIIYTYEKAHLKTKKRVTKTINFKGHWNITEKHRILYVLNKKIDSQFDFKVSLGKPLKRGLQYKIGIGSVPSKEKITLFGEWKVNRRLGVLFEMPYEKGILQRIVFGASCKPGKNSTIEFKLRNELGKDLGMDIKLSKKILKDQGEIFLRAITSKKEKQFLIGGGWRW
ncbi:MAG: hypothetical protein KAS46_05280 [Candidatus Aureabacteria bacterium]|nr:hypothetical protein [Candidatus Auribacterota bacterium]